MLIVVGIVFIRSDVEVILDNYFDSVAKSWDDNPVKFERAEAMALQIRKITFSSNKSVMDFGSGTGLLGIQLRDLFSHVILADASTQMLAVANEKITAAKLENIETLQVNGLSELQGKQSAIVTLMTLHHIYNLNLFFADASEKLEENGMLIIADLYKEDGSFHQHHSIFDGHNGFDVDSLSLLAKNRGFEVISINHFYDFKKGDTVYPLFLFVAQKLASISA